MIGCRLSDDSQYTNEKKDSTRNEIHLGPIKRIRLKEEVNKMPRNYRTGSRSQRPGASSRMERGGGRGQGGGFRAGPGGYCVCPNCGKRESHQLRQPCYQMRCPQCGSLMTRE